MNAGNSGSSSGGSPAQAYNLNSVYIPTSPAYNPTSPAYQPTQGYSHTRGANSPINDSDKEEEKKE